MRKELGDPRAIGEYGDNEEDLEFSKLWNIEYPDEREDEESDDDREEESHVNFKLG